MTKEDNKKHLGIVTYCTWTSIGSILQTFALSETLNACYYHNTIWLEEWNKSASNVKPHSLKELIIRFHKFLINGKIQTAYKKRMEFISNNVNALYLPCYEGFENCKMQEDTNIFLAGSDQIWNPDRINPIFFLEFVRDKKCISYAASMGKTMLSKENKETFKNLINNFDTISVREEHCKEVLQGLTDKQIFVHIDPSFLLCAHEWRQYERRYPIRGPYILVYMIYWDQSCKAKIKELKKRTGLPVYAICSALSKVYADKYLYDVGVEEFLWLIDHAEYVITSSFHGAAMSTIFNKKFAAVINPSSPSRIENLLQVLSIPLVNIDELDQTNDFDYRIINTRIEEERRKSIEYLKEAIG